ncbi:aquaporin, partial [Peribacillus sp. SIMBA_075]
RIAHAILPIPGKGPSNWKYAWVPVVGPILGGAFGGVFYNAAFKANVTPAFWIVSVILVVVLLGLYVSTKNQTNAVNESM